MKTLLIRCSNKTTVSAQVAKNSEQQLHLQRTEETEGKKLQLLLHQLSILFRFHQESGIMTFIDEQSSACSRMTKTQTVEKAKYKEDTRGTSSKT